MYELNAKLYINLFYTDLSTPIEYPLPLSSFSSKWFFIKYFELPGESAVFFVKSYFLPEPILAPEFLRLIGLPS